MLTSDDRRSSSLCVILDLQDSAPRLCKILVYMCRRLLEELHREPFYYRLVSQLP